MADHILTEGYDNVEGEARRERFQPRVWRILTLWGRCEALSKFQSVWPLVRRMRYATAGPFGFHGDCAGLKTFVMGEGGKSGWRAGSRAMPLVAGMWE